LKEKTRCKFNLRTGKNTITTPKKRFSNFTYDVLNKCAAILKVLARLLQFCLS